MLELIRSLSAGNLNDSLSGVDNGASGVWGYFLAAAVGLVILLGWKKPSFWKNEIWAKGRAMKFSDFLSLLCIFLSGQLVYQMIMVIAETILNLFGLSAMAGMAAVAMDSSDFGMFLYGGILAPVTEEILFRGLVQRTLMPYGKRFAILCSAFTFGIFHGNLFQAPYAFLVGLVLGYVACEYSIAWAMVLHMVNNLVLGDMIVRLTSGMSEMVTGLVIWAILLPAAVAALVIMIAKRKQIGEYRRENPIYKVYRRCFFSSPGTVLFLIVMGISMVATVFVMITPI
jgi:membrane protease YdiL (CAAX protease family)